MELESIWPLTTWFFLTTVQSSKVLFWWRELRFNGTTTMNHANGCPCCCCCSWIVALLAFFGVTAVATLQCYPGSSCDSFYYCVTIPCNHFKAVLVIPCGLLVDTTHQSLNSLKITTKVLVIYLFTNNEGWQTCMASIKSECFAVNLHLSILKILINTQNTYSICKIVLVLS